MKIFKSLVQDPDLEWEFIDGSIIRAHQHSTGSSSAENEAIGKSRGGNTTKMGLSQLRGHSSSTEHSNSNSIIFKISKAISSSLNQLHLAMKPFGNAVRLSKTPHSGNLISP